MELEADQVITVILALVSGLLFLFRMVAKQNGETKIALKECEDNHKDVNTKLFDLNGKVERMIGRGDAAEEMAEKVINEIRKNA